MVTFTTTDLIAAIKRTSHVAAGNKTFLTPDFLAIADTEMRIGVAPKVASARENYWLTSVVYPSNSDNRYPIPSKALGSAIVEVKLKINQTYLPLTRISVSELYSTDSSDRGGYVYYLEDNIVKILPGAQTGDVEMWYYRIPSKLVPVTECGQISEINGDVVTLASVPSNFSATTEFDIVSEEPGFNVLLKDSLASISGSDFTFSSLPSSVSVGDYVCLSGRSCVVQCPIEWIEVLTQRVACKIYQIQGYSKKLKDAKEDLKEMEMAALSLVSPRTVENPKIISAGGSLMGSGGYRWKLPYGGR